MTNPTSNFGWQMPTSTDLVTDLPADFETFGQAVDTSLADLKGGTTGQILSKASNTNMDFTWVTTDDANAIQNSIVDAKGDIVAASANDTPARLAVGSNGETLVADSSTSTGLRWQGTYAAGKNKVINGQMQIAQRGTSISGITAAAYSLDRWEITPENIGTFTASQDTQVPTGAGFGNSLKLACTTADAAPAAGDRLRIIQRIEGNNVQDFAYGSASAKTVTLSFWVRSSKTGTYILEFWTRQSASNKNICVAYTISAANTWQQVKITIAGDTATEIINGTGAGFDLYWWLAAGSNYTSGTLSTTWGTPVTANRAVGQVNFADSNTAEFYLTGVQFEIGAVATPFTNAGGTIQGELAACQRYYFRNANGASTGVFASGGAAFSTTQGIVPVVMPVPMRVTPTTLDTSGTASNYRLYNGSINTALNAVPTIGAGDSTANVVMLNVSVASGLTAGSNFQLSANSSTTAFLGFGAEL
jgi:hypothetical protein